VKSGDDAEGWQVGAIALRSMILERNGRTQFLAISVGAPVDVGAQLTGETSAAPTSAPPSLADAKRARPLN